LGSSFGHLFRISTWGESHGGAVGVNIEGCPPGLERSEKDIQPELDRRRPGQSHIATPRDEADRCEILSGVFEGRTLGTPIAVVVRNKDARSAAYSNFAHVSRCPDPQVAEAMISRIEQARSDGDSLGGVVRCVARAVPPGLGDPVFDKLDADLAKAMVSIPACKGMENGSGFAGVTLSGQQHNDPFYMDGKRVRTRTNHSGGIQGGISNGEDILLAAAFKPTATITHPQDTVNDQGEAVTLKAKGRHDPCVLPRAVPVVEAMAALVLCDHYLRQRGQCG